MLRNHSIRRTRHWRLKVIGKWFGKEEYSSFLLSRIIPYAVRKEKNSQTKRGLNYETSIAPLTIPSQCRQGLLCGSFICCRPCSWSWSLLLFYSLCGDAALPFLKSMTKKFTSHLHLKDTSSILVHKEDLSVPDVLGQIYFPVLCFLSVMFLRFSQKSVCGWTIFS